MKKLIYLLLLASMIACKPKSAEISDTSIETTEAETTTDSILKDNVATTKFTDTITVTNKRLPDISSLKGLNGSTFKSDFFDNLIVNQRLKKLLGKERYTFMIDYWGIGRPVEIVDNILVASGCMSHYCPETNFIVIIDIAKNTFHVGIRDNDVIKTYTENESNKTQWVKDRLQQWMNTYGD